MPQGQTFDAYLYALNEQLPITAGPVGRLTRLVNAQAKKFARGGGGISLRVEKRDGFITLPTVVRNPATGGVSSASMANPKLLATLGSQLLLAASTSLFVLSEAAGCWESPIYTAPTQVLREKPVFNGSTVDTAPSSARVGSRTFYVWTDPNFNITGMILDDDGTMIRSPIGLPGSNVNGPVKVVSDGTRFWIVASSSGGSFQVSAFDTNGVDLGTNATIPITVAPLFDIAVNTNASDSIVFVQRNGASGWQIRTISWNGSSIVVSAATVVSASLNSTGRIAFLRNDRGDHNYYIVAVDGAGPFVTTAWGISDSTFTIGYTDTVVAAGTLEPFEIGGYVRPTGNADLTVQLSYLDTTPTPQLNLTEIYTATTTHVNTLVATRKSLTQVTTPFVMNGSYYAVYYYHGVPSGTAFTNNIQQSTFFLVNLDFGGNYQVCGRWDNGTAYADWQTTASSTYYMHLSTPTVAPDGGIHFALTYRATSFTTQTINRDPRFDVGITITNNPANTVGIRDYSLGPDVGIAFEAAGELFIPGPQATSFTGTSPTESGIPLVPEQTTAPATAASGTGLTPTSPYQVVIVAEWTDNNGNRARGPAGPPYNFTSGGGGNLGETYTGTMLHVSQKLNIMLSAYRTAIINGTQSTQHYKVTNDLAPTYNSDGSATFSIVDTMTDAAASVNEILYTDKGFLDRFPCPPFSQGCQGASRAFVVAYDGAVWFSGEKTEGDALWFTPVFRILLPSKHLPKSVAVVDNTLLIFDDTDSIFAMPISSLPDATGAGGIPEPTLLPLTHGSKGFAVTWSGGVMFASTQGGIWNITRGFVDQFIGSPVRDETAASPIIAMNADANQRVYVTLANGTILVYDAISECWYTWTVASPPLVTAIHKGALAYADAGNQWRQQAGTTSDFGTAIITTARAIFQLGGVRSFKRIWGMQLEGAYVGAHTLNVSAYYDDDFSTVVQAFRPFVPAANVPYVYELPPKVEVCSSVALEFSDAFPNGPSGGFQLELVSFYLAMEKGLGRLAPSTRRIAGV